MTKYVCLLSVPSPAVVSMKPCVCSFIGLAARWKKIINGEKGNLNKEMSKGGRKENTWVKVFDSVNTWVKGGRKGEGGGQGGRVNCACDVPSHLRIKGLKGVC